MQENNKNVALKAKKEKLPSAVTVAILTLLTIFFWVSFEVFRVITKKESYNISQDLMNEFSPNLDKTALEKIEKGLYIPESEMIETTVATDSGEL